MIPLYSIRKRWKEVNQMCWAHGHMLLNFPMLKNCGQNKPLVPVTSQKSTQKGCARCSCWSLTWVRQPYCGLSHHGENVNIGIFFLIACNLRLTKTSAELCLNELYPCSTVAVTLTYFEGHSGVGKFSLGQKWLIGYNVPLIVCVGRTGKVNNLTK